MNLARGLEELLSCTGATLIVRLSSRLAALTCEYIRGKPRHRINLGGTLTFDFRISLSRATETDRGY